MLGRQDVVFNRGLAASISVCTEPAEAHSGVCHAVLQQTIQDTCIAAQERGARFPALCGVLSVLKAVLLHPAQSGAGNPGTALQLCKIDLLQRELVSLLGHHLLNGLCHNRGHGCEIGLFHLISFHRGWLRLQCKGTIQIVNGCFQLTKIGVFRLTRNGDYRLTLTKI